MIICMICDQAATVIRPHHTSGFPACDRCNAACNAEARRMLNIDLYGPPAAGNYRSLADLSITAGEPAEAVIQFNPRYLSA